MSVVSTSPNSRSRFSRSAISSGVVAPSLTALSAAVAALSPAGYWKLSDAASPPQDSSGNARHASATTNVTYRGIAASDGASYPTFTGNQKIPVADNNAWTVPAGGLSFFFLARLSSLGTDKCVVCKGPSSWEWSVECASASGEIRSTLMDSAGNLVRRNVSPTGAFVVNTWAAFCVTFSDNTTAATITQYKNSNTALTPTVTTGAGVSPNGAAVLQLTARSDTSVNGIDGSAAHMAVFPGVLNTTQVQTLMDAAHADLWF